ncbi:MAG: hypothetical protein PVF96_02955 [Candidatus Bathyarchaeota archaeon]|jgi:hypothetical protein
MLNIREILEGFKAHCESYGWTTFRKEDWVKADDGYHLFIWTKNIRPSSFNRIVTNRKYVIRENELSYNVIEASYIAWLFFQMLPDTVVTTVLENHDFRNRIALYNLGSVINEAKQCYKLNYTKSLVFKKFEDFLKEEMKTILKPIKKEVFSEENTIKNIV